MRHPGTRELILEMIEQDTLDKDFVLMCCLKYMSQDQLYDMARVNELFPYFDEEEEVGC